MLRGMDLLEQNVAEKNLQELARIKDSRRRTAEQKAEGFDIFMMPFKVFDPNRFLDRTQKYVRWIWRPPAVLASLVVIAIATGVIVRNFTPIWAGTLELYAFLRKPFWDAVQFFVILTSIGLIHELAHGYVCKFYGGEVHDIGVALLYFMPAFYCDTTDSLLFPSKWHRLWVMLAGMYIEAIICSFAVGLWVASYPDTLLHELTYKLMLFTGVSTIFFNINPLRKIDGYYALSSVLEIPELREDSFEYVAALFKKYVLRLNVEVPRLSRRKRRIFLIYGPAALGFMVLIMWFIGNLFYNFYAKYFPNVAIVLLVLTLLRLFRKQLRVMLQGIRLVYLDKKEWLMSRRVRAYLLSSAGILLVLLAVPWAPWTVSVDADTDALDAGPARGAGGRHRRGRAGPRRRRRPRRRGRRRAREPVGGVGHCRSGGAERGTAKAGEPLAGGRATRPASFRRSGAALPPKRCSHASEDRDYRLSVKSPIAGRVLTHRMEDLTGPVRADGRAHRRGRGRLHAQGGDPGQRAAALLPAHRLAGIAAAAGAAVAAPPRLDRSDRFGGADRAVDGRRERRRPAAPVGAARAIPRRRPLRQRRRLEPSGHERAGEDLARPKVLPVADLEGSSPTGSRRSSGGEKETPRRSGAFRDLKRSTG